MNRREFIGITSGCLLPARSVVAEPPKRENLSHDFIFSKGKNVEGHRFLRPVALIQDRRYRIQPCGLYA